MPGSLTDLELAGIRLDQEAELDATCIIWRQINDDSRVISKVDATFAQTFTQTIFNGPCFCAPIVSRRDRFDVHNEQQHRCRGPRLPTQGHDGEGCPVGQ
jgi:hypothetical protein